jgi:hypothetical protein
MLGLSATMNRKDGTTKIFKMFLGDIIYKEPVPSKPLNMNWVYIGLYFILGFIFIYGMAKAMTFIFGFFESKTNSALPS